MWKQENSVHEESMFQYHYATQDAEKKQKAGVPDWFTNSRNLYMYSKVGKIYICGPTSSFACTLLSNAKTVNSSKLSLLRRRFKSRKNACLIYPREIFAIQFKKCFGVEWRFHLVTPVICGWSIFVVSLLQTFAKTYWKENFSFKSNFSCFFGIALMIHMFRQATIMWHWYQGIALFLNLAANCLHIILSTAFGQH